MRYSMIVYLTNMIDTLIEAMQYIKASSDNDINTELIENGIEMINQIEDTLERFKPDLKSEIPLELLQNIENALQDREINDEIINNLNNLRDALPQEIDYKVRAVFFAELGEKWDSMESVYAYMRDDPRFDPVVVLTPVFRVVNFNGEQKQEVIYKDYLTDLGISFYEYNQYSLEEDVPDLAFISQPYESCTLPEFWPENIAKYTRLVYLPYYLLTEGVLASVDTLCTMPVYDVAWRVAGVNEKHFEYYSKYSHNNGANMMVTGIPKLDHLVLLNERGIKLPEGWEKIRGKKVFLWNTRYDINVSSLQYFDNIIKWFETHEDCALIWRPHPLTNMVTKLYHSEQYEKLKGYFKIVTEMTNTVLDQEISYEAAFYYSNAMISDVGSMIGQYLLMDKPLMHIIYEPHYAIMKKWTKEEKEAVVRIVRNKDWMEPAANNAKEIYNFFERISRGEDMNEELRKEIRNSDLSLADGQCGVRICNLLWDELHKEDGLK